MQALYLIQYAALALMAHSRPKLPGRAVQDRMAPVRSNINEGHEDKLPLMQQGVRQNEPVSDRRIVPPSLLRPAKNAPPIVQNIKIKRSWTPSAR